jgi:hypothetical protein
MSDIPKIKNKKTSDVYERSEEVIIKKISEMNEERLKNIVMKEKLKLEEKEILLDLIKDKEFSTRLNKLLFINIAIYNSGLIYLTNVYNLRIKMKIWKRFSAIFIGNFAISYYLMITTHINKMRGRIKADEDYFK